MRRRASSIGAGLWIVGALGSAAADEVAPLAAELPSAQVESALARVYPALVNLTVVNEHFGDGRAMRGPGRRQRRDRHRRRDTC